MPCFEEDGCELLEATSRLDLEGMVAKRKGDSYEPPKTVGYKIENPTYAQAEGRRERFERGR